MTYSPQPRMNEDWIVDLCSPERREAALADLRPVLVSGLRRCFPENSAAGSLIEDFAQEALLRIADRIGTFRGDSHFETWAISIAVRVGVSELRRVRWRDVSLDQMANAGRLFPSAPEAFSSLAAQEIAHLLCVVKTAIETQLTERQRHAIEAELSGAPPDEIAERMGTNRNALYKLTHDARVLLKRTILSNGWSEDQIRLVLK